ncbi:hypothetical protein HYFRA_00001850 [Hymenoscyphus fraxineus]|uniref:Uncharacterized protein n=1 Tax=Hymenoscyphus fraxineus TaxID=746836 RepID=A0A9N9KK74_9HELO|nr:hypothetical protein HYFRA_00001850 [Hymenoscyphus fraxineus]
MRFTSSILLTVAALAIGTGAIPAAVEGKLHARLTACEQEYGVFPAWTGPCEDTNCGASGTNCEAISQGCIAYPSVACPAKGCTCTTF